MRLAVTARAAGLASAACIAFLFFGGGSGSAPRPRGVPTFRALRPRSLPPCHGSSARGAAAALLRSRLADQLFSCRGHPKTERRIQPDRRGSLGRHSGHASSLQASAGTGTAAGQSQLAPRVFFGLIGAGADARQAWRTQDGWQIASRQWQARAAPYGVSVYRRVRPCFGPSYLFCRAALLYCFLPHMRIRSFAKSCGTSALSVSLRFFCLPPLGNYLTLCSLPRRPSLQ